MGCLRNTLMICARASRLPAMIVFVCALGVVAAAATLNGVLPGPLPLFPRTNWWNVDVSQAPVDSSSASFISFIGTTRRLHPDFGGEVSPGSDEIYGFPYLVVDGTQPKHAVQFDYSDESDGVNHTTDQSFPFYPIPDEAITQAHWIEGGQPGNVDLRSQSDRHLLIVDRDNRHLYELYNVFFDGASWHAGSGAFFDLSRTAGARRAGRPRMRPDSPFCPAWCGTTRSFGPNEIEHALRVTVRATNGYVYPASHRAGSTTGACRMGARLRSEGEQKPVRVPAGDSEDFPRDAALRADRRRQRVGHVHQRHVRHAVGQQHPEPGVRGADGQRLRGGHARVATDRPEPADQRPALFRSRGEACLARTNVRLWSGAWGSLLRSSSLTLAACAERDRWAWTSPAPYPGAAPNRRCRAPSRA